MSSIKTNNLNENILSLFEEKAKGRTESVKIIRKPEGDEWMGTGINNEHKIDFDKTEIEYFGCLLLQWSASRVAKTSNYEAKFERKFQAQNHLLYECINFLLTLSKRVSIENLQDLMEKLLSKILAASFPQIAKLLSTSLKSSLYPRRIVTDPRCGEINAYQITSKSYLLRVDRHPPAVSAIFHPASRPLFYDAKKNILVVEESRRMLLILSSGTRLSK